MEKNLLNIADVNAFYCPVEDLVPESVVKELSTKKAWVLETLNKMRGTTEKKWRSIDEDDWMIKFRNLDEGIVTRNPNETMLAWRIYENELNRINEIMNEQ